MSMNEIRKRFNIRATQGCRIKVQGRYGTITGAKGLYLRIKLDGDKRSGLYHPSWEIDYRATGDTYYDEKNKIDEEETEEVKKEITEYEDRMLWDPNFAKEDDELLNYLEEIDPNDGLI